MIGRRKRPDGPRGAILEDITQPDCVELFTPGLARKPVIAAATLG